jgi:hypothetical protein
MKFTEGEQVVLLKDGNEVPAVVLNWGEDKEGKNFYQIEVEGGTQMFVVGSALLPAKKAGFAIRDLAFVLDESRDAVQGEIIAVGTGPKNRKFYQLKFDPAMCHAQSWYSEDQVFTISSPSASQV